MEKYIPLDAVLAEIERRKQRNLLNEGAFEEDIDILSFINTFEMKEVDLGKEIQIQWKGCCPIDEGMGCEFANISVKQFDSIAKHFFKLGVNASNPLTWEDIKLIWNIGDEIPYMPEEDFFKELLNRFKAQKGE